MDDVPNPDSPRRPKPHPDDDAETVIEPRRPGDSRVSFAPNVPSGRLADLPTVGHIGRYALKYSVGDGAHGKVYIAHDPLLSRSIAIKTLDVIVADDQRKAFDATFLNEARAAAGLSHPNIVTVFDAGVSERGPYIAMELLKGRDLRQLQDDGWRPTPTQAAVIVRRVADALGYAHAKGVVHRDVKPANIFMVGRTQPRVLDFGVARIAVGHESLAGNLIDGGSPQYIAPEQLQGDKVDRRADIYSLGVVLYELLTATKPFKGSTLPEIGDAVLNRHPPSAHEVDRSVPRALSDIAARAMQKNPDDRYRSAREMSRDLRDWLAAHSQQGEPVDEPAAVEPGRRWWLIGSGALVAGALVLWFVPRPSEWRWTTAATRVPAAGAGASANAQPATAASAAASLPDIASAAAAREASVAAAAASSAASADAAASAVASLEPASAASAASPPPPASAAAPKAAEPKPKPAKTPPPASAPPAAPAVATPPTTPSTAVATTGSVRIAISPWGQIEVDGRVAGVAPPLTQITLSAGEHTITVRNEDFPPHTVTLTVVGGQSVTLRHRFE